MFLTIYITSFLFCSRIIATFISNFDDILRRLICTVENESERGDYEAKYNLPYTIRSVPIINIAFFVEAGAKCSPLKIKTIEGHKKMSQNTTIFSNKARHLKYKHQYYCAECDTLNRDPWATGEQLIAFYKHQDDQSKKCNYNP